VSAKVELAVTLFTMVMDLHGPRSILAPTNVREFKIVVIGPRKVGKSGKLIEHQRMEQIMQA